jgi:hypothetical protein
VIARSLVVHRIVLTQEASWDTEACSQPNVGNHSLLDFPKGTIH